MNLFKTLSIFFLPWVLFAEESISQDKEITEECHKDVEVRLSENLKTNNPFIPYKNSGKSVNIETSDSSNFEFFSFAEYPTHQEFSLKDNDSGKTFWLSSDGQDKGLDFGIKYWKFYPKDHLLIIQEVDSGTLINVVQKKPEVTKAKSAAGIAGGSNEDFFKLLSNMDDFDDENDEEEGK